MVWIEIIPQSWKSPLDNSDHKKEAVTTVSYQSSTALIAHSCSFNMANAIYCTAWIQVSANCFFEHHCAYWTNYSFINGSQQLFSNRVDNFLCIWKVNIYCLITKPAFTQGSTIVHFTSFISGPNGGCLYVGGVDWSG